MALGPSGTALAQAWLTERKMQTQLEPQGHKREPNLTFREGVWRAKARSADDRSVSVRIDPRSSEVFSDKQVPRLSEADVRAQRSTQGYTHVCDVDFKEDEGWSRRTTRRAGRWTSNGIHRRVG